MKAAALDYDPTFVADVLNGKELATVIRESATQTLLTSLEREGLTIDPAVFARLMRELGNNVAQAVCGMEVQS